MQVYLFLFKGGILQLRRKESVEVMICNTETFIVFSMHCVLVLLNSVIKKISMSFGPEHACVCYLPFYEMYFQRR